MTEVNRPPRVGGWTRFVTARPRLSLLVALVITALAVLAGSGVADRLGSGGWEDPDAESTYATKALEREFPASQPNLLLLVDAGDAAAGQHGERGDHQGHEQRQPGACRLEAGPASDSGWPVDFGHFAVSPSP